MQKEHIVNGVCLMREHASSLGGVSCILVVRDVVPWRSCAVNLSLGGGPLCPNQQVPRHRQTQNSPAFKLSVKLGRNDPLKGTLC